MLHHVNTNRFNQDSEQANHENDEQKNSIDIALNFVPENIFDENKTPIDLLHYILIIINSCKKYLIFSVCRHISYSISASMFGGISINNKKFHVTLNTIIKFITC